MRVWLSWFVRLMVAGLFVYAGAVKWLRPDAFLADIESYRMLPYWLAWLTAFYLPPLEVVLGGALLARQTCRIARWVLLGLIVVFMAALIQAWLRGLEVSCGCFGAGVGGVNYIWLIGRDFFIFLALLFLRDVPNDE